MPTLSIMTSETNYNEKKYPVPTSLSCTRSLLKKGEISSRQASRRYLYYIHWYTYRILDKTTFILRKMKESPSAIPSLQHRKADIVTLAKTVFSIIKSIRLIGYRMSINKAFKLRQELHPIHKILDSYIDTL